MINEKGLTAAESVPCGSSRSSMFIHVQTRLRGFQICREIEMKEPIKYLVQKSYSCRKPRQDEYEADPLDRKKTKLRLQGYA